MIKGRFCKGCGCKLERGFEFFCAFCGSKYGSVMVGGEVVVRCQLCGCVVDAKRGLLVNLGTYWYHKRCRDSFEEDMDKSVVGVVVS